MTIFLVIWGIPTAGGFLTLLYIAFRRNALTSDDLPPRLKRAVGLIVFCPGPIGLAILIFTQDLNSISFRSWAGGLLSTAMFLLILLAPSYRRRLIFDRKLQDKIREKK